MKFKNILLSACAALVMFSQPGFSKEIKIGMAIDDLRLERWQKDRDILLTRLNPSVLKFCSIGQWQ